MKKTFNLLFLLILLLSTYSVFSQATATITQVPGGTVKPNTAASDGVTPADYIFSVTNIAVPDPANPPTIFIEAKIADVLVANRLPKVDPADTGNVTDNGDGTYNAEFVYTKLNNFGAINFDDIIDITMGISGVAATPVQVTVEPAPAVQIDIVSVNTTYASIDRGGVFTVDFMYSCTADIEALTLATWITFFEAGVGFNQAFLTGSAATPLALPNTSGVSTAASIELTFPTETTFDGGGRTFNIVPTADLPSGEQYVFRFRTDGELSGGGTSSQTFNNGTPQIEFGGIDYQAFETLGVTDYRRSINHLFAPNPAVHSINISKDVITDTYRVLTIDGRIIKEVSAEGVLDVSDLNSGIYFLVTDHGAGKFVKK